MAIILNYVHSADHNFSVSNISICLELRKINYWHWLLLQSMASRKEWLSIKTNVLNGTESSFIRFSPLHDGNETSTLLSFNCVSYFDIWILLCAEFMQFIDFYDEWPVFLRDRKHAASTWYRLVIVSTLWLFICASTIEESFGDDDDDEMDLLSFSPRADDINYEHSSFLPHRNRRLKRLLIIIRRAVLKWMTLPWAPSRRNREKEIINFIHNDPMIPANHRHDKEPSSSLKNRRFSILSFRLQ